MTPLTFIAIGVAVWGGVFVFLMVSLVVESDIARRWNDQWVESWERSNARSVDDILNRLAEQIERWRKARRLALLYLVLGIGVLAVVAGIQVWREVLTADTFRSALFIGAAVVMVLMLPLVVVCEIGVNLVENMRRHLRNALGERIVISARHEIDEIPKPKKEKKKPPKQE